MNYTFKRIIMFEYTPLLLKKRNIINIYDAIPFWKLKLTGEEYEGLKSHLKSLVLANKDFSSFFARPYSHIKKGGPWINQRPPYIYNILLRASETMVIPY